MTQGVPGRLRPRIFLTLGTTRVVGRQPYASAAFTPGEIPGTHFQRLSRPQSTWFRRGEPRKKSPVTTPGIDLGTVRLVAQCLNHYAIPGPCEKRLPYKNSEFDIYYSRKQYFATLPPTCIMAFSLSEICFDCTFCGHLS